MSCIYSLCFQNAKRYIGMTSMSVAKRMANHRLALKSSDAALYRAWRKHGDPEVKTLAVIEKYMLRDTERKAIAVFNTMVPNGYNLVAGGEGGGVSAESRRKMSLAGKGRPKTAEHRRKIGLGQIGRIGPALGKKQSPEHIAKRIRRGWNHSEESKAKMSALKKGCVMPEELRKRISESMKRARAARPWSTKSS